MPHSEKFTIAYGSRSERSMVALGDKVGYKEESGTTPPVDENTPPTVTAISPTSIPVSVTDFELTVTGTNFRASNPNSTLIYWDEAFATIPTTVDSPTSCRCTKSANSTPGSSQTVTVKNGSIVASTPPIVFNFTAVRKGK